MRGGGLQWAAVRPDLLQVPFRRLYSPRDRPVPEEAGIVTAYTDGQVTLRSNRDKIGYHEAADLSGYQGVEPGDLVVHGLDILRGSVGVSDSRGAMSSVCTVCKPNTAVDGRFVAYVIRAQAMSGYTRVLARGIREGGADFRRWDTLGELPVPVRPFEEQRRIADFLDDQVARMDAATQARLEQATLLKSAHIADIYRHLSGATSAEARVPTDAQWLQTLPESWRLLPVGRQFDVQLGQMLNEERATGAGRSRYLRNANVTWYEVRTDDLLEMSFDAEARMKFELRIGDLLVCEGGAGMAEAAVLSEALGDVYYSKALHRVRATGSLPVEWLMYWLRLAKETGIFEAQGGLTTIPHLPAERLREDLIPWAPDANIRVTEIERRWRDLEKAKEALLRSLDILSEYKRSLITAAVTGELDVTTARPMVPA